MRSTVAVWAAVTPIAEDDVYRCELWSCDRPPPVWSDLLGDWRALQAGFLNEAFDPCERQDGHLMSLYEEEACALGLDHLARGKVHRVLITVEVENG